MTDDARNRPVLESPVLESPYRTVLKPYGHALVELARQRPEIVCLSGDLTRQCEVDLFQAAFPDRFIHAGMAEANMIGVAGALARSGLIPFVHTFGVFATRRPFDQIVNAVAYPHLPVRIIGFMPGVSSPGGPSHQAIEDVALMRALPGMTVVDVADATETVQVVAAIADLPGPVYLRLKRGEIPVIFPEDHRLSLDHAQVLAEGPDQHVPRPRNHGRRGDDRGRRDPRRRTNRGRRRQRGRRRHHGRWRNPRGRRNRGPGWHRRWHQRPWRTWKARSGRWRRPRRLPDPMWLCWSAA